MANCWSCTVIIKQDEKVCPFCAADQTKPVEFVNPHLPQPRSMKSTFRDWGVPILVIVAASAIVSAIYWHSFGEPAVTPAAQATGVAAKSLRDLREALSIYALSAKDSYPTVLASLGNRVSLPMQEALGAGYRVEYSPKSTSAEIAPRGFVILARPEKNDCPNLYIDETGVVRATQENRSATAKDPPL